MGFLRPVAMEKIGVVALKSDRESVVTLFHDLGVVQVEPLEKATGQLLPTEPTSELQRKVADQLLRFRGLKETLPRPAAVPPRSFSSLDELLKECATVDIDSRVGALAREEDALRSEGATVSETISLLEKFSFYTDRLELLRLQHVLGFFGEADRKVYPAVRDELGRTADVLLLESPGEKTMRFVVATNLEKAEAVSRLAQQRGILLTAAPPISGTIPEALPRLTARKLAIAARREEIRAELATIGAEWGARVAVLEEALSIENRKLDIFSKMGAGRSVFALEGWVPARSRGPLERLLAKRTGDRAWVYPIPTTEMPPTLLDNPPGVRKFEFFIRFYSLPESTEWDPTFIFAFVFPILFGFMLSDWGYGLSILSISVWMLVGFPGGRRIPRMIKGFPKMIMGPATMQSLAWTLLPGAVIAIVLGLITNEAFGAHLPFYHGLYDPFRSVGLLFIIAGFIGLAMVSFGFVLGALKEAFRHHRSGVYARTGGLLFAWGIAFLGLQLVSRLTFQPLLGVLAAPWKPAAVPAAEWVELALMVVGVVLLLLGEGGQGFIALTEILSHVLSYVRLVGILVSSIVIALIVNKIGGGLLVNGTALGAFAGAVVLVGGQAFNLILGVFEPGIQGARLIFVEHFSKYYSGNGEEFHPFGSRRTHTLPTVVTSAGER
jgi:V/A-type H+/Na+-transporting ATPase subunit I